MVEYFGPRDLVLDGQWVSGDTDQSSTDLTNVIKRQILKRSASLIFHFYIIFHFSYIFFVFFLFLFLISSSRRSSRTTKERQNTNLEEHNTADLYTKMFGGIENAVARQHLTECARTHLSDHVQDT